MTNTEVADMSDNPSIEFSEVLLAYLRISVKEWAHCTFVILGPYLVSSMDVLPWVVGFSVPIPDVQAEIRQWISDKLRAVV
jgi:hypothetical protein